MTTMGYPGKRHPRYSPACLLQAGRQAGQNDDSGKNNGGGKINALKRP